MDSNKDPEYLAATDNYSAFSLVYRHKYQPKRKDPIYEKEILRVWFKNKCSKHVPVPTYRYENYDIYVLPYTTNKPGRLLDKLRWIKCPVLGYRFVTDDNLEGCFLFEGEDVSSLYTESHMRIWKEQAIWQAQNNLALSPAITSNMVDMVDLEVAHMFTIQADMHIVDIGYGDGLLDALNRCLELQYDVLREYIRATKKCDGNAPEIDAEWTEERKIIQQEIEYRIAHVKCYMDKCKCERRIVI